MGPRRQGRELAVQALYQVEVTGDASAKSLGLFLRHFEGGVEAKDFARRLIAGVLEHRAEIDRRIEETAENWKLDRIAKVDLVILRLATYELLCCADDPVNVSIDEAIEIAKRFGAADSSMFLNGIFDLWTTDITRKPSKRSGSASGRTIKASARPATPRGRSTMSSRCFRILRAASTRATA